MKLNGWFKIDYAKHSGSRTKKLKYHKCHKKKVIKWEREKLRRNFQCGLQLWLCQLVNTSVLPTFGPWSQGDFVCQSGRLLKLYST